MERIDTFHQPSSDFSSDLEQGMARMVIVDINWIIIFLGMVQSYKKVEGGYAPMVW